MARLERDFDVRIITQNVDNLHERAGSTHVLHLHGELMKARSSKNPNLITELTPPDCDIHLGDLAADGSQLRPFIVWFNEAVPMIEPAIEQVSQADIFVIVGTSLNVYPAAGLLNYVPNRVPVYLIDPKEVRVPADREITVIRQGATEGVKTLTEMLSGKE